MRPESSRSKPRFAGLTGNVVKLKRADGETISVPLERLSGADREYLESLRK